MKTVRFVFCTADLFFDKNKFVFNSNNMKNISTIKKIMLKKNRPLHDVRLIQILSQCEQQKW